MIGVAFDPAALTCDLALGPAGLLADDGLTTAVLLSLLTDARAKPGDRLPDGVTDRRGWWGDALSGFDGDRFGSRLWLLCREKQTEETRRRAEEYATEALAWLITDGAACAVAVAAAWRASVPGRLDLTVTVTLPAGGALTVAQTVKTGS